MASTAGILAALGRVGSVYGQARTWVDNQRANWSKALSDVADAELAQTVERWIASDPGKVPTPAQLLALRPQRPRAQAVACGLCMEGWREVAIHFRPRVGAPIEVGIRAVRCPCQAGQALAQEGATLDGYLAWVNSGRCDRFGNPAQGDLVRVIVDPRLADRLPVEMDPPDPSRYPFAAADVIGGVDHDDHASDRASTLAAEHAREHVELFDGQADGDEPGVPW